MPKDPTS